MTPLAEFAHQAGFKVSGSDLKPSHHIDYLKSIGITDISIGQSASDISRVHADNPIDWLVASSAVGFGGSMHPEIEFARNNGIRVSKRDELIQDLLEKLNLKMLAVAGTHGKTTTTSMLVYLSKKLNQPISYMLAAETDFAHQAEYISDSELLIYEADEFDRNFLSFSPQISVISGIAWDHHEIYPTETDYFAAFHDFISQSQTTFIWDDDWSRLAAHQAGLDGVNIVNSDSPELDSIALFGKYNRRDALIASKAFSRASGRKLEECLTAINGFPGLSRRMERLAENVYTDYAHTPEKITAALSVAREMTDKKIVVIYEPLTNRRQKYIKESYKDCFNGVSHIYWVPSYLARENPAEPILSPEELISYLGNPAIAEPARMDERLLTRIKQHAAKGDMVIAFSGGGAQSLDEWLRRNF